jgi:AraC-like DNA-binding protein
MSRTDFIDFEALRDVTQDSQSKVMQLARGRMNGSITHLALDPTFGIAFGDFSKAVSAEGMLSPTRWHLGLLTRTDGPAVGHHTEFAVGDMLVAAPGQTRHVIFRNNTEYFTTMIEPQELQAFLGNKPGAYELMLKQPFSVLHVTPAEAKRNINLLKPILDTLTTEGAVMPDDAVAFYKRNILCLLTAKVREAYHDLHQKKRQHLASHEKLVREMIHYINEAGMRPIHISELCEHFGVHRRTLHRAFHEVVGIGPVKFMRKKRLNEVHTVLREARGNATIHDIARDHGFLELGRFSGAYRRMFGELPKQTRQRNIHRSALGEPVHDGTDN